MADMGISERHLIGAVFFSYFFDKNNTVLDGVVHHTFWKMLVLETGKIEWAFDVLLESLFIDENHESFYGVIEALFQNC
jgi:hypothetical protein